MITYSKNAIPQLASTASISGAPLNRKCPYHANVIKTFDAVSIKMGSHADCRGSILIRENPVKRAEIFHQLVKIFMKRCENFTSFHDFFTSGLLQTIITPTQSLALVKIFMKKDRAGGRRFLGVG